MRGKAFSMVTTMVLFIVFMGLTFISTAISEETVTDPKALEGRWEGSARGTNFSWSSYFAQEIFAVDTKNKKVIYRGFCPERRTGQKWYTDMGKLSDKKGEIGFETPDRTGWSGITFELKGNRLSGSATGYGETGNAFYYDYSLKRVTEKARIFDPKELIGEWMWVEDRNWFELTISEVDSQNKTLKGKYRIGRDKTDYDLSNAKIITEGEKLKIDFKTMNDTLHYQLAFYPNFGEYPPALWGKLEKLDGNVSYPMFGKKGKTKN